MARAHHVRTRVVGDFRARQIAVFTGSFLIVLVATSFIGWLRPANAREAACVGIVWLVLTLTFEITFGRYVVHASWSRIASEQSATGRLASDRLVGAVSGPSHRGKVPVGPVDCRLW